MAQALDTIDLKLVELEEVTNRLSHKNKAVKELTLYLEAILDTCPVPMWLKSKDGKMLFFNQAFGSLYGYDAWTQPVKLKELSKVIDRTSRDLSNEGLEYEVNVIPVKSEKGRRDTIKDHLTTVQWRVNYKGEEIGTAGLVTSVFP